MSECFKHLDEALVISRAMIQLADRREVDCSHDGCLLLDSVIRDCAYKIRAAAERFRRELEEEESGAGTDKVTARVEVLTDPPGTRFGARRSETEQES